MPIPVGRVVLGRVSKQLPSFVVELLDWQQQLDWHAGEAAQVWAPGGCVEVMCEEAEWSQGWMGAEAAEAASQVEAAVDAPSAWLPAEQAWDPAASTSAAWDGTKYAAISCMP